MEKYIIGAIVLLESVRGSNANNTINDIDVCTAVVCHKSVNMGMRSFLQRLGHDVIVFEDVQIDEKSVPSNHFKLLIQKYIVFDLMQYEKALFMDSDAFILRPENLKNIFDMLDDEKTYDKPVDHKHYIMKQINAYNGPEEISRAHDSNATNILRKRRKVFMAPDLGRDSFNSGIILYRPQPSMFKDFWLFLKETILPKKDEHRKQLVWSTQRLLQEFLLMPTTTYSLYNFCPKSKPSHCSRLGCDCGIHIYPQTLDC